MPGAGEIRAGGATVEIGLKDKVSQGLQGIQSKLSGFGAAVSAVGGALAAAGGAILGFGATVGAVMAKSVGVFMEVSEHARKTGQSIAGIDPQKSERLSEAWNTLKATWGAIQFTIGSALAGPLTILVDIATDFSHRLLEVVQVGAAMADTISMIIGVAIDAGMAFGTLGDMAFDSITGIVSALASGDISTALEIVTTSMGVLWDAAMVGIKTATLEAFNFVLNQIRAVGAQLTTFTFILEQGLNINAGNKTLNEAFAAIGTIQAIGGGALGASAAQSAAELTSGLAELAAMNAGARDKFADRMAGVTRFNARVGGVAAPSALGGSFGTFSGAGAGLLGIGSGGGQKVSDDKTHTKLDQVIKALNDKDGPTFK